MDKPSLLSGEELKDSQAYEWKWLHDEKSSNITNVSPSQFEENRSLEIFIFYMKFHSAQKLHS